MGTVAGTYAPQLDKTVRESVDSRWATVEEQAHALNDKLQGDSAEWSTSASHRKQVRDRQSNPDAAYWDELRCLFRGADMELDLDAMPPDQQAELNERSIEGTGRTLGQLKDENQGFPLRVYSDAQHRLYVQRPTAREYSQGLRNGAAANEPAYVALARVLGRPVSLRDSTNGTSKTYYPDSTSKPSPPTHPPKPPPRPAGRPGNVTPSCWTIPPVWAVASPTSPPPAPEAQVPKTRAPAQTASS